MLALRSALYPLALLRIAVCVVVLISPEPRTALAVAQRSPELWFAPEGMHWFLPVFSALSAYLPLVHKTLQASAALLCLGLWSRGSCAVMIPCFLVMFGGAQLTGTVLHDMHLFWFLLLLLVSPCAKVFSLDAWRQPSQKLVTAEREARAALLGARILLGLVYLFPGLHKLLASGTDWALGDNVRNQLHFKWYEAGGIVPAIRIDQIPGALQLGGLFVLLFELSFVFLVFHRRGRWLALAAGLSFHAATQYFFYIPFPSLWLCYVVLLGPEVRGLRRMFARLNLPILVAAALITAVTIQGLRGQTQSYPFACYPTFENPAPDTIVDLAVEVRSDAEVQLLRLPANRAQHEWGLTWRVAGLYGATATVGELYGYAEHVIQRTGSNANPRQAQSVSFYLERYRIAPEAWGEPPVSRRRLRQVVP